MSTTEFENIWHNEEHGKLRIGASGISWKALEGAKVVNVPASEMKWAEWARVARNYQLRIGLKDTFRREGFEGFKRDDQDQVGPILREHFDINMEVKELSWRGWNWGSTDFRGQDLVFLVGNKTTFEIPLASVANSNIAGKTEVSLEFIQPDSNAKKTSKNAPDELMELRMYIPGTGQKDGEEEDGEDISAAQLFHDTIKEKADIGQVTGESIVIFHEVLVSTPRGRYDIHMFPNFLRLHGKTYDYKVPYNTISRLFLLPRADEQNISLVINLDPPIRQGQTRYPFLVLVFSRDETMQAELNVDDETLATKYEAKLEKSHDGPAHQVVASVFKGLVGKNIARPSPSFASRSQEPSHPVKCSLKAVQGELYFLEKSIFFLSKQPLLMNYNDILTVVFTRLGGGMASAKTIDVRIEPKSASDITFSSVAKSEKDHIEEFLALKKVRVKTEADEAMAIDLGSDDEEMQSVASSDEERPKVRTGGADDDESSEDEDFQASSTDEGSPTSESDEDGSGAETASESPKKPAKKAKRDSVSPSPKKKKKAGSDDGRPKKAKLGNGDGKSKSKTKPKVSTSKDESDGEGPAKKKMRLD